MAAESSLATWWVFKLSQSASSSCQSECLALNRGIRRMRRATGLTATRAMTIPKRPWLAIKLKPNFAAKTATCMHCPGISKYTNRKLVKLLLALRSPTFAT